MPLRYLVDTDMLSDVVRQPRGPVAERMADAYSPGDYVKTPLGPEGLTLEAVV